MERAAQPAEPSLSVMSERNGDGEEAQPNIMIDHSVGDKLATSANATIGCALPPGGLGSLEDKQQNSLIKQRANYTPLRLTAEERQLLHFLEGALDKSEYTDNIDVFSSFDKGSRVLKEIEDVMRTQIGLQIANNYTKGKRSLLKELWDNQQLFRTAFEVLEQ
jgi:hypothetical protein